MVSEPIRLLGVQSNSLPKPYGLDSFGQIEAIRYTWNGQLHGVDEGKREPEDMSTFAQIVSKAKLIMC